MSYQKQLWKNLPDQTTPLSADRLNHLETQYEEAKAYTDSRIDSLPPPGSVNTVNGVYGPDVVLTPADIGAISLSARSPRISVQEKTHLSTGVRYVVTTAHLYGAKIPGLLGKEFAGGFSGGSNSSLKPPREDLSVAGKRLGVNFLVNASGWETSGNVGEMVGAQIKDGIVLHEPSLGDWRRSDSVGFTYDGEMKLYSALKGDSTQDMISDGVENSWAFGPCLVVDGVPNPLSDPFWTPFKNETSARQIIGQRGNGDIVFLSVNGKTGVSGLTGPQTVQLAVDEGLYQAFNLDGGGSVQTNVGGVPVVSSSDNWGRRPVPDFLYMSLPTPLSVPIDPIPLVLKSGVAADQEDGRNVTPVIRDFGTYVALDGRVKKTSGAIAAGDQLDISDLPSWAIPPEPYHQIFFTLGQVTRRRKLIVNSFTGTLSVLRDNTSSGEDINSATLSGMWWSKR